jgi:rare lipoprotein A
LASYRRVVLLVALLAAACNGNAPRSTAPAPASSGAGTSTPPGGSSRYYKDDGPAERLPGDLDAIPDAVPTVEPLHRFANRPYSVLGRDYVPATSLKAYRERGIASWYGRKFHGQPTSTGETYDMFAMSAAHPTLPLPSYARVTSVATGRSVVVRVNDRGPFLHDRIIDLSYAAAHRLGIAQRGSGEVEVEAILPGAPSLLARVAPLPAVAAAPVVGAPAEVTPVATPVPAFDGSAARVSPGGYAVQLGAFASYANAQNFLAHAQNQLASASVEPKVRQAGGLYRVYVGPYADRDEARRAGERITQAFGFATSVGPH